jgi:GT2 family glycosyltransferase
MVLCDLIRHNKQDQVVSTFRRRDLLPVNGDIFKWVLQEPSLAPSSVLMHRRVLEEIGGFNEGLRTAEDLDYHLRIAARFRIGIVEQALVRTLVGNGGLSSLPQTYEDHLQVVQNAVDRCDQQISERDKRRALALANARCARGMILSGRTTLAWKYFREAWRLEPSLLQRFKLLRLATLLARREVAKYRTNQRA